MRASPSRRPTWRRRSPTSRGTARRPPYRPGLRQRGSAQQPYAQPGYGPAARLRAAGYGQRAGTGSQAAGRGGMQSRRDPAIASPWERLAACVLDWIIIFVVSVLAFWSPLVRVWRELQAIMTSYQEHNSPAAQAAINNLVRQPANQHALLVLGPGDVRHRAGLLLGAARRLGRDHRQACSRRPGRQAGDRSRIGIKAAGIRAVAFLVGPAMLWLLARPISVLGGGAVGRRRRAVAARPAGAVPARQAGRHDRDPAALAGPAGALELVPGRTAVPGQPTPSARQPNSSV